MSESIQQNAEDNCNINDNGEHSVSSTISTNNDEIMLSRQRKELFGDCALIEIIHLHDCLRGALKALEYDVKQLAASVESTNATTTPVITPTSSTTEALERRVAGRFKVIWTVFKSHSHAEDEFIWPALKTKTAGRIDHHHDRPIAAAGSIILNNSGVEHGAVFAMMNPPVIEDAALVPAQGDNIGAQQQPEEQKPVLIEQEEYEEDHADEERMFSQMDSLLTNIREAITSIPQQQAVYRDQQKQQLNNSGSLHRMVKTLVENTQNLSQHLMAHLQKEETQCMPLVKQHLSKDEIHELVGQIMGQRSADTIAQIMTMAIQNLNPSDRHEMVKYMKESMAGTFFDRWLLMSGWMKDINSHCTHNNEDSSNVPSAIDEQESSSVAVSSHRNSVDIQQDGNDAENDRKLSSIEAISEQQSADDNGDSYGSTINNTSAVLYKTVACGVDNDGSQEEDDDCNVARQSKRIKTSYDDNLVDDISISMVTTSAETNSERSTPLITVQSPLLSSSNNITSQAELEKLIRAIASNPSLTPAQKNTTIQGLRDSVWKSNQRHKQLHQQPPTVVNQNPNLPVAFQEQPQPARLIGSAQGNNLNNNRTRRITPPSAYFRKNESGKIETVWSCHHHHRHLQPLLPAASLQSNIACPAQSDGGNDSNRMATTVQSERELISVDPAVNNVPLFSASELAPTYHDGAAGTVLGCPHYARACKVRHPKSGRLYTCLICCEQQRELPNGERDDTLDRYAVTEVMCMKCTALQPADDRCVNPECESYGKPFAKYFCNICHLYDDGSRPIFHCPYCNICRLGLGLGIDFRHCMRCNACVSLADKDHRCIPQKLQGNCPICREELFLSTAPLRGLKCGHVMHLSCFVEYRRGLSYTCPLCIRAMEDMTDYFALLDAAIRMQPMPVAYLNTMSNIYCQECNQTCRVPFHFIGKKCSHCGSYNTRELGRVQVSPTTSPILNT